MDTDVIDRKAVFRRLESIRNLPTLPMAIRKLGGTIRSPSADAHRVASIIEDDPSMMARILRIVNSAFYGGIEPITSVQQAVARMGFTAVNNIAMSTAVFSAFETGDAAAFDREAFWHHCIATGMAASVLYERCRAQLTRRYTTDILHLSGLIHDIGKIIFEQSFHPSFLNALDVSQKQHLPLCLAEPMCIGADHAEVGGWLAAKWKLSPDLISVIRWHHEPHNADVEHIELVMLCHCANYICNHENIGNSGDAASPALSQSVWKRLGLDLDDMSAMTDDTNTRTDASELMMSLRGPSEENQPA